MGMLSFNVVVEGMDDWPARMRKAAKAAEHALALEMRKDTAPFVPALTGSMDMRTKVDGGKIVYPGPYARYLYYGKLMVDPDTGSAWAKKGTVKVLTDKNLVFSTSMHGRAQSHWFEAAKALNKDKWIKYAKDSAIYDFKNG